MPAADFDQQDIMGCSDFEEKVEIEESFHNL